MNNVNWGSLNPIEKTNIETDSSIDWSMEVYNSGDYVQTQSVSPDYRTLEFYKH